MDPGDTPQRFTPDEIRRILEVATESESSPPALPPDLDGFTLVEIQEVTGEVGIDPAEVERASRSIVRQVPLESGFSAGTYQVESRFQRC